MYIILEKLVPGLDTQKSSYLCEMCCHECLLLSFQCRCSQKCRWNVFSVVYRILKMTSKIPVILVIQSITNLGTAEKFCRCSPQLNLRYESLTLAVSLQRAEARNWIVPATLEAGTYPEPLDRSPAWMISLFWHFETLSKRTKLSHPKTLDQ